MRIPPFKMKRESVMERYRYNTWLDKEAETITWLSSFDPHDVFFDVGSNIGIYTLYRASIHPEGVIYAFEPSMVNYHALLENIEMNKFHYISAFPVCIGGYEGEVAFDDPGEVGASGGQMHAGINFRPLRTVDSFSVCPDHVKIDIDGQELEVVKGMRQTIPHIKSILIEVSSKTKQAALDLILPHGFTTDNRFNRHVPHSRTRRKEEGIDAENIIFTRP